MSEARFPLVPARDTSEVPVIDAWLKAQVETRVTGTSGEPGLRHKWILGQWKPDERVNIKLSFFQSKTPCISQFICLFTLCCTPKLSTSTVFIVVYRTSTLTGAVYRMSTLTGVTVLIFRKCMVAG